MARKFHQFMEDAQSGAGNCLCGAAKEHVRHPHLFRRAHRALIVNSCVCSLPADAEVHDADKQGEVDTNAST